MKCLFTVVLLSSAIVAVSCSKGEQERKVIDPDAPEWFADENLPVPIEFGIGSVTTTAAATRVDYSIEPEGLFTTDWFRYGVLAMDQNGDKHISVTGVEARNVPTNMFVDGVDGKYKAEFVDGDDNPITHYYPVLSDRNYTFYAYHTKNSGRYQASDLGDGVSLSGIEIGRCDVLWARCAATTIGSGVGAVEGFNAKYIRHIADANNFYLSSDSAPRFNFSHKTSRFIFFIKAENAYAESTMTEALVSITGIKIKGVNLTASMDVTTGVLTGTGSKEGEITVNRDEETIFQPVAAGAAWGDPLFVLPSSVENAQSDDGIEMTMSIRSMSGGEYENTEYKQILKFGGSATAFEAGRSYTFTITIKSYEKIEITTSVENWNEEAGDDFVIG